MVRSLGKFYPSLGISHNLLMGLGVSDFVSVGHIVAILSSHYTFSSRAQILKRQPLFKFFLMHNINRVNCKNKIYTKSNYCLQPFLVTSMWSGIHWTSVTDVLWPCSMDETAQ